MSPEDASRIARVSSRGAVLLGSNAAVDGPDARPLRAVTHAHSDHLVGLSESKRLARFIVASPATLEMLEVLGYRLPPGKIKPLEYGSSMKCGGETVTLLPARHIVGAAQVLVETDEGFRTAYTGDFKLPGTPVIEDLDVLVIESTYGRPDWVRPFKEYVEPLLVDIVLDSLSRGPVHIYGYYGKLQEAMDILRRGGVSAPFIASGKVYRLTRVAEKYGLEVGELVDSRSPEARDIVRSAWFVEFHHMRLFGKRSGNGTHIVLSGWEFREPVRRLRENTWLVALSDHADFEQLLEYVEEARPRFVFTDAYRDGAAQILAREIERRLGIPAAPSPA